ncbi:MAG: 4Fe-4S binding protein [Candidatus Diapherotrites archaeon]|nr:4Fe-4S binding protein [Candidatus Diapherotrites archaeon]
MVKYNQEKCLYCGGCVSVCPVMALELMETYIKYDAKKCINCNSCVKICPVGAFMVEGR